MAVSIPKTASSNEQHQGLHTVEGGENELTTFHNGKKISLLSAVSQVISHVLSINDKVAAIHMELLSTGNVVNLN